MSPILRWSQDITRGREVVKIRTWTRPDCAHLGNMDGRGDMQNAAHIDAVDRSSVMSSVRIGTRAYVPSSTGSSGMRVGLHVSILGSIDMAVERAVERQCDTFQIFTRNPRTWRFGELADGAVAFRRKVSSYGIWPVVVHMPYLPNLASPRQTIHSASVRSLLAEVKRCEVLNAPYLVAHLGSHLGAGAEVGSARIVQALSKALSKSGAKTTILLENTSGSRNSMGSSFEDINDILIKVDNNVNVCFDTCHAFAAGYDMRGAAAVERTLEELDDRIGLKRIKVVHINDSKGALGSRLDRHEHIGLGKIGAGGFRGLFAHPRIREIPLILETPIDRRRDDYGNMRVVRKLASIS